MAKKKVKARSKPQTKTKAKSRTKAKVKVKARVSDDELASLREELSAARAELARIASEESHARHELEKRVSSAASLEERLRAELEAVRLDLRTALADRIQIQFRQRQPTGTNRVAVAAKTILID